jgi:50S ribosomal subunit-associated GTPase HflX
LNYLRGAAGAIVVCDLTRPQTLAAFDKYTRIMRTVNPNASLVFVGNKLDLITERGHSENEIRSACLLLNDREYILSSARTGEQVERIFALMAERVEVQG